LKIDWKKVEWKKLGRSAVISFFILIFGGGTLITVFLLIVAFLQEYPWVLFIFLLTFLWLEIMFLYHMWHYKKGIWKVDD
jgi:hypothetical protein